MSNKLDTLIEAHEKTKILAEKANKALITAELNVNRLQKETDERIKADLILQIESKDHSRK